MRDITGLRSGKLVAQRKTTQDKHKSWKWLCLCDCGNTKEVVTRNIVGQKVKTCGCSGKAFKRLDDGEAAFNELFGRYKKQAMDRGYCFELSKEQFKDHTESLCYYCGAPPKSKVTNSSKSVYYYNGVDRKDNTLGYTPENTVPCCAVCNRGKRDMGYKEFTQWIENLILFTKETSNADSSD